MILRARMIRSRTVYQGRVVQLKLDEIVEPGNVHTTREIVKHGGSVVVLAHLPDGKLLLVRQFRYAAGRRLWELVAGGIEQGESVQHAARRELLEETGYEARRLRPLFRFYPSPGVLTEQMHLVDASGLRLSKASPEPDERIEIQRFTIARLQRMIRDMEILDGKTLVGLLWAFSSPCIRP